jgi:hypothetical protein
MIKDNIGAGNVLLYDSLDIPNREKEKPTQKTIWREILAIALVFLFVFCMLILLHNYAFTLLESYHQTHVVLGWILIVAMYGSVVFTLCGGTVLGLLHLHVLYQKNRLVNLLDYQTDIKNMTSGQYALQYFNTLDKRMVNSLFAGVQNLTYSPSRQGTEKVAEAVMEDIEEELQEQLPLLQDMQKQGLIARSNNSVLLGVVKEDV